MVTETFELIDRFEKAVDANGYRTRDRNTEEEYRAAKAALEAALSAAEPVKPAAEEYRHPEWIWYCESTTGPMVTFGRWAKNPQQKRYKLAETQPTEHDHPAPSVAVKALEWRSGATQHRQVASVFDRPMYEVGIDNGQWYWIHNWNGLALRRVDSENEALAAAQADYDARIRYAPAAPAKQEG